MGRSISYNKRELEKKREQKKKLKKKRKEERKANNEGNSFDDMIAYVDENGVITDTPPDPDSKTEVDIEDIQISTPKKEKEDDPILIGRVEHFNEDRGYGFIKDILSGEKYFFHVSNAFEDIQEGQQVEYELERGDRGMNAVRVKPVSK